MKKIDMPRVQIVKSGVSRMAIVGSIYSVELFYCGSMRKLSNVNPSARMNNFFLDAKEYEYFLKAEMMKIVID